MEAHKPTDESRGHVELLTAVGITQVNIAAILGISVPTLKAHYGDELKLGKAKMIAQVGATLFQQAVGRPAKYDGNGRLIQSELKPDRTSAIFIMKTQAGWKETSVVEISDPTAGARERLAGAVSSTLAAQHREDDAAPAIAPGLDPSRPN